MEALDFKKTDDAESVKEVFSKPVRAGKRTYFFDVKATKNDDYFLVITESRKQIGKDGLPFFNKHKIYLYKEDFENFIDGMLEAVTYVKTEKPEYFENLASKLDRKDEPEEEKKNEADLNEDGLKLFEFEEL